MNDARPILVLASASPRRRELLSSLGLDFEVRPSAVNETPHPGEQPHALVRRLAIDKVRASARPGEIVLAADTIVTVEREVLGKPRDAGDARRMLRLLGGREHTVLTGVALMDGSTERLESAVEASRVRLAQLSAAELDWYLATGEPFDKAGAYAIQGLGAVFVEAVFGSYTNVVGLPLPTTYRVFQDLGCDLLTFRRASELAPAVPAG